LKNIDLKMVATGVLVLLVLCNTYRIGKMSNRKGPKLGQHTEKMVGMKKRGQGGSGDVRGRWTERNKEEIRERIGERMNGAKRRQQNK
jgi:hypothetical protein|tara:strand:+ start:1316 stop:1579 length:264 start_codon:yes stop_codon:yes gene_type:complete